MAASIPELNPELNVIAQEVVDVAKKPDSESKAKGILETLYKFVPAFFLEVKQWTGKVIESEKIVFEALKNLHSKITKAEEVVTQHQNRMDQAEVKEKEHKKDIENKLEKIEQVIQTGEQNIEQRIKDIETVIETGDKNTTAVVSGISNDMSVVRGEFQQMAMKMTSMQNELDRLKHSGGGGTGAGHGGGNQHRPENIMNNKAVFGLKSFQADKAGFRIWNDKLINALSTVSPDMRKMMNKFMTKVDYDKTGFIDENEYSKAGGIMPGNMTWEQIDEMIYFILMDKTEGEAFQKVRTVSAGKGIAAYQKIYNCIAVQRGWG